jgi:hypothetical protein
METQGMGDIEWHHIDRYCADGHDKGRFTGARSQSSKDGHVVRLL